MPFIKFNKTERRRLSLFLICTTVAGGAWMFLSLSGRYIYQVQTLVRFVNFPQNKAFKPLQSDTINLQVEGTGWQLLFSKMRINPQSVDIDLDELNKKTFVDLSLQLPKINRQFESSQRVVQIEPDTLYFDFSARSVKRIPIRLVHRILFMPHYGISDSVKFFPDYVTVTGPRKELDQIKSWPTDTLKLKNLSSDLSTKISLQRSTHANISIYPATVDVRLKVDEFTEKIIEVPVKLINDNGYGNVKILPDKIQVTFLTALSNYSKIDRSYFELSVDLNNWKNKGYKQLPVHIGRFPDYCKLIRIEPQNVDFIIQR